VQQMRAVLRPFRVVTVASMVITPIWVATATSGLLQRTIVTLPVRGTGGWVTVIQTCTGLTTISNTGSQSVVLGIKFVLSI